MSLIHVSVLFACFFGITRGYKGCRSSLDCNGENEGCRDFQCVDLCSKITCKAMEGVRCRVIDNIARCTCDEGFNPAKAGLSPHFMDITCTSVTCVMNGKPTACTNKELSCVSGKCIGVCSSTKCVESMDTKCMVVNNMATCVCKDKSYSMIEKACTKTELKKFSVHNQKLSWSNAQKECQKIGGNLAVVTSAQENDELKKVIKETKIKEGVWLGAWFARGDKWRWVNGMAPTFSDWHPVASGVESGCISTTVEEQGRRWAIFECNIPAKYACSF